MHRNIEMDEENKGEIIEYWTRRRKSKTFC